MEVVAGFFCVWVERKFLDLGSGEKKIYGLCLSLLAGFVFMFVC